MSWPQNAYVGQKVVCVNATPNPGKYFDAPLVEGNVYTIAECVITHRGNPGFKLVELPRLLPHLAYRANRFRPIQSTETGMEMLRGLLNPKNHKVLEKV